VSSVGANLAVALSAQFRLGPQGTVQILYFHFVVHPEICRVAPQNNISPFLVLNSKRFFIITFASDFNTEKDGKEYKRKTV
jgi:hypothetical protein